MLKKRLLTCIAFLFHLNAATGSSQWTAATDTDWQTSSNWTNGVPGNTGTINNPDLEALFLSHSGTVNLLNSVTLNTLDFENNYTISGSALTLGGGTQPPQLTCNHTTTFNNPFIINSTTKTASILGSGTISTDSLSITNSQVTLNDNITITITNDLFCNNSQITNAGIITPVVYPTNLTGTFQDTTYSGSGTLALQNFFCDHSQVTCLNSITFNSGTFQNNSTCSIIENGTFTSETNFFCDNSQIIMNITGSSGYVSGSSGTIQNDSTCSNTGSASSFSLTNFFCDNSTLSNNNGGSITITSGTIQNNSTCSNTGSTSSFSLTNLFCDSSTFNNSGTVTTTELLCNNSIINNSGTITSGTITSFQNHSTFNNSGTSTITALLCDNSTVINNNGGNITINNSGTFQNHSTFDNSGTGGFFPTDLFCDNSEIRSHSGGFILFTSGTFQNNSIFTLNAVESSISELSCNNSQIMNNNGSFMVCTSGTFENNSICLVTESSSFQINNQFFCDHSTINNSGTISCLSTGTFQNRSIFNNSASGAITALLCDNSTINNSGAITCTSGTFQNHSTFNNSAAGTITALLCDNSTISNNSGAITCTSGTFQNNASVMMSNGSMSAIQTLNMNDSTFTMSNNSLMTTPTTTLINSELSLFGSSYLAQTTFNMDANSKVSISNSTLQYTGTPTLQPINFAFLLNGQYTNPSIPSVQSAADIDFTNSQMTITANHSFPPGSNTTFVLFGTQGSIHNFNLATIVLDPSTLLYGPIQVGQEIIITADTPYSSSLMATSLLSNPVLTTSLHIENMQDRMRGVSSNRFTSFATDSNDSFLAQNSILAQKTPVEQLGERAVSKEYPWSVYLAPTGSFGSTKTNQQQLGSSFYSAGVMTGFDWATSFIHHPERDIAFGIGSTVYYAHLHSRADHHRGLTKIDHIFANIYGTVISKHLQELSFNFSLGAGYDWHEIKRVTGRYRSNMAHGSTRGYEVGSFVGLEYLLSNTQSNGDYFRFIPMLLLEYTRISINDYKEHGAGEFNVKVHSDALNSLRSFLGARANHLFQQHNVSIRPEITFGWQREYLGDQHSRFSTLTALTPQTVFSQIVPARNTLILGGDLYVTMFNWTSLQFNYQFSFNDILIDNDLYLEWKVEF